MNNVHRVCVIFKDNEIYEVLFRVMGGGNKIKNAGMETTTTSVNNTAGEMLHVLVFVTKSSASVLQNAACDRLHQEIHTASHQVFSIT